MKYVLRNQELKVSTPFTARKVTAFAIPQDFINLGFHESPHHPLPIRTPCLCENLCALDERRRKQVCAAPQSFTGKITTQSTHLFVSQTNPLICLEKLKIISVCVSVRCVVCSVFQRRSTWFGNKWETKRREPGSQEV